MHDFIDPALGIPVALILFGVYILMRLSESRREQKLQRTAALISAIQLWGNDPSRWPSEVRDVLGVAS